MKILVTGGTGFIGSFLVSELEEAGHEVWILTNDWKAQGKNVLIADIRERDKILSLGKFDMIYHLAGVLGTSELNEVSHEASEINILGTLNLLDLAKKTGAKFVNITKPNVWLNTYSITKHTGEEFTKMYRKEFGVRSVSVKWFNVYGPNQSFHCQKAVPFFIRWALNDEDIHIWGDGEQTADFIHAKDAVRLTIKIAEVEDLEGETVDVGSGEETTVNELAEMIVELSGSKSEIVHRPMRAGEDEGTKLKADPAHLWRVTPEYTLRKGLKETIEWYRQSS